MDLEAPRDEVLTQKDQANTCVSTAWLRLSLVLVFITWPVRNIALVCWVYGGHAYFHDGLRILPGKPVRFSNGLEVPALPDMVTGFGAFIITFFGLTILLILGLRYYERHFARPKPDA
jgi:hypothetical protein